MKIIWFGLFVCISLPSCDSGSSAAKGDGSGESAASEGAASEGADEEKLAKAIVDEQEKRGRERKQKTEVAMCLGKLIMACDSFFEEYQALPMANASANDAEQVTDNDFMAPLLGLKVASDENPKFLTFFSWKAAKGTGNSAVGGLVRTETTASLVDPWGNFYRVICNYDYDDKLREPQATGRNEIISNRRVLAYSLGPDGIAGGKGEKDNIYSWVTSERTFQDSEKRTSENSKPQISHEEKDSSVTNFEPLKREPKLSLEAEALKAELKNGLDPDSFKKKTSLLGIAIKEDDYSRAWILLNNGADPEMPTGEWNDMLPLQLAASERNVAICDLLLSKGADPNGTGKNQTPPVAMPFRNGGANRDETREIFDLLKQKDIDFTYRLASLGGEKNWTGFVCEAVKSKNPYFLRVALDQGAPLNLECFKPSGNNVDSGNLIYKAVKEHGEIELIQLYVNKIQSESQIAIEVNERGRKEPFVNNNGNTPLLEAISKKRPKELINYLISIGADPKNTNEAGWNALHQSSFVGDLALFKDFLDKGLDIDSPDKWGKSPLMRAVEREDYQTVKGLLKLGADTAQKDSEGKSALDLAREKTNNSIIKLLESSKQ